MREDCLIIIVNFKGPVERLKENAQNAEIRIITHYDRYIYIYIYFEGMYLDTLGLHIPFKRLNLWP